MDVAEVLADVFARVDEHVREVVRGLSADELVATVAPDTNPIGWLVWHLTRVQDDHVAELIDSPQVWVTGEWAARFGVEADPHNTGYGHSPADVAAVRPDGVDALLGYHEAVANRTNAYL